MLYTLMHRDIPAMDLELDEYSNIVSLGKIHHAEHLPLGTYNKIGVERKALNRWWTKRSIPASRKGIREVLEELEKLPGALYEAAALAGASPFIRGHLPEAVISAYCHR